MKKGRSNYTLQFNCNENTINQLMQSYLTANGFVVHQKKGENYYRAGDQMMGYRGLIYSISNNNLTIYAWLDGALGNFPLEQNSMNIMAMNYRNSLNTLFQEISKLNNGGNNMNQNNNQINYNAQTGQPINQNIGNSNVNPTMQTNTNQFAQTFQDETLKKKEKMCEIGFWISLVGVLLAIFGFMFGLIIYAMNFYFASQGLKTRKKGKAIATIVLSIISLLIIVLQLILA